MQKADDTLISTRCGPSLLDQNQRGCLQEILGEDFEEDWRVCKTSADGYCLFHSMTDFLKRPTYPKTEEGARMLRDDVAKARMEMLKNISSPSQQQNQSRALLLQQIEKGQKQITASAGTLSYHLAALFPYDPFGLNYILINNQGNKCNVDMNGNDFNRS